MDVRLKVGLNTISQKGRNIGLVPFVKCEIKDKQGNSKLMNLQGLCNATIQLDPDEIFENDISISFDEDFNLVKEGTILIPKEDYGLDYLDVSVGETLPKDSTDEIILPNSVKIIPIYNNPNQKDSVTIRVGDLYSEFISIDIGYEPQSIQEIIRSIEEGYGYVHEHFNVKGEIKEEYKHFYPMGIDNYITPNTEITIDTKYLSESDVEGHVPVSYILQYGDISESDEVVYQRTLDRLTKLYQSEQLEGTSLLSGNYKVEKVITKIDTEMESSYEEVHLQNRITGDKLLITLNEYERDNLTLDTIFEPFESKLLFIVKVLLEEYGEVRYKLLELEHLYTTIRNGDIYG